MIQQVNIIFIIFNLTVFAATSFVVALLFTVWFRENFVRGLLCKHGRRLDRKGVLFMVRFLHSLLFTLSYYFPYRSWWISCFRQSFETLVVCVLSLIGALWIRLFRPVGFSKSANVSMEKIAGIFQNYYLGMFEDGSADLIIQRFLGICTKWMLNPMNRPTVQLMLRRWVS